MSPPNFFTANDEKALTFIDSLGIPHQQVKRAAVVFDPTRPVEVNIQAYVDNGEQMDRMLALVDDESAPIVHVHVEKTWGSEQLTEALRLLARWLNFMATDPYDTVVGDELTGETKELLWRAEK